MIETPDDRLAGSNMALNELHPIGPVSKYFDRLWSAPNPNVEQQLNIIKKIINSKSEGTTQSPIHQEFLIDRWFDAPLKHPTRNVIVKYLKTVPIKNFEPSIERTFEFHLKRMTATINPSASDYNSLVIRFITSFDIFDDSLMCWESIGNRLIELIQKTIDFYIRSLNGLSQSPIERNELLSYIHNSIRLILLMIKKLRDKDLKFSEIESDLNGILSIEHIPLDTKINCGTFLAYNSRSSNRFTDLITNQSNHIRDLSICIGLINSIDTEIDVNLIGDTIQFLKSITDKYPIDIQILLAVNRGLLQAFKLLNQIETYDDRFVDITERSFHLIIKNMDHIIDSVRYSTKDLFGKLIKFARKFHQIEHFVLLNIRSNFDDRSINLSEDPIYPIIVEQCCQHFGTDFVVEHFPKVHSNMLMGLKNGNPNFISCYEQFIGNSCDKNSETFYIDLIEPLIDLTGLIDDDKIVMNLINWSIKRNPMIVSRIMAGRERLSIANYLNVVVAVRKMNADEYFPDDWEPGTDEIIIKAMVLDSPQIRLMALRLIIDVHRTTDPFSESDLQYILSSLHYNFSTTNESFIQQLILLMIKCFDRLKNSLSKLSVDNQDIYQRFLLNATKQCISDLPIKSDGRKISLIILLEILKINNSIIVDQLIGDVTEMLQQFLIDNSNESNKICINEIFKRLPFDCIRYLKEIDLEFLNQLTDSVKVDDTITAAYLIEFGWLTKRLFDNRFDAISWCERKLQQRILMAKNSLLQGCGRNTLYGMVYCIRHSLKQFDYNKIDLNWKKFFQRFITICMELNSIVGPIVNSSSPEGYMPTDNQINVDITSQMVLLCAWRTVQEVSLFLGELSRRSPLISDTNPMGLLTGDDLLRIGSHFLALLTETKHRGAFEQCYVGFLHFCTRLWQSTDRRLNAKPMEWLRQLFEMIDGRESVIDGGLFKIERICATRRSAGLPFIVQAIVISELDVNSQEAFDYCMERLFDYSRLERLETKIHSLNILRMLFRCSELNKPITTAISAGFECALNGYLGGTFAERNSATLLFAAVMTRAFGVQRTKDSDNLSIKNKMTGTMFFQRYPQLYDRFLLILLTGIKTGTQSVALHPVLLILDRLYSTTAENSNQELLALLPALIDCCHSTEYELRRLAIKAVIATVPLNDVGILVTGRIDNIMNIFKGNDLYKFGNNIHGDLQIILGIVRLGRQNKFTVIDLEHLFRMIICIDRRKLFNSIIYKSYVDVLIELIFSLKTINKNLPDIEGLSTEMYGHLIKTADRNSIGDSEAKKSYLLLYVLLQTFSTNKIPFNELFGFIHIHTISKELISNSLNILLEILIDKNNENYEIIIDLIDVHEIQLTEWLTVNNIPKDCMEFSIEYRDFLWRIIDESNQYYLITKSYILLSQLDRFQLITRNVLEMIVKRLNTKSDDLKMSILIYLYGMLSRPSNRKQLMEIGIREELFKIIIGVIRSNSIDLRIITTKLFTIIIEQFKNCIKREDLQLITHLIRDDCNEVRLIISNSIIICLAPQLNEKWINNKERDFNVIYTEELLSEWVLKYKPIDAYENIAKNDFWLDDGSTTLLTDLGIASPFTPVTS